MPELEIGLVEGDEMNLYQSFLQFSVKKNIYAKSSKLKQLVCCYNNSNFTMVFLSVKDNFFKI